MTQIHFVSLPHTETIKDYCWCAYTMKQMHIGDIMSIQGINTILYAGTRNEGKFTEHVEVVTDEDRKNWYGHINWDNEVFGDWNPESLPWQTMNQRAIVEIKKRLEPDDIIAIIAGRCQESIVRAFPNNLIIEWAVGYEGVLDFTHRCFESYAWQHYVYGRYLQDDGRFFDTVIPNSFDLSDFLVSNNKADYLLYLGRLTPRKGMAIVEEIAKKFTVYTAGQGNYRVPNAKHLGVVRGQEKAELLANARAVLVPTLYIEPFGGVAVEAMLSGTPVITTPWGAFSETVQHGVNGFKCRMLSEFLDACEMVDDLDPLKIETDAIGKYSLDAVSLQYKKWINQLGTLYKDGWYN